MRFAIAIIVSIMLGVSGFAANAAGPMVSGENELHQTMVSGAAHCDDVAMAEGMMPGGHDSMLGCVAGHCAMAFGFLATASVQLNTETYADNYTIFRGVWGLSNSASFDPPPPRT